MGTRTGRVRNHYVVIVAVVAVLLGALSIVGSPPSEAKPRRGSRPAAVGVNIPAAGPDILHLPAPAAPQLTNSGVWTAAPTLVGGTSAYRGGEFLYQDFLYDDLGANSLYMYPTHPSYAGNAADFVELRLRPLADATAVRITYNSLLDPDRVATTIALGDSAAPAAVPHGANASAPAQLFVTVHGTTATVVDAATGAPVAVNPAVSVDLTRRQVEVRVPYAVFDPRGQSSVRVAAATGLWDRDAVRYLVPQGTANDARPGGGASPSSTAFFNVAFRYEEPLVGGSGQVRESQQSTALATGDLSPFFALVDFTKLASATNDDLTGQRGGVPSHGYMNRIFASHFETKQGRGDATSLQTQNCPNPCTPARSGQLQSYSLYVPDLPQPSGGFGLTIELHGSGGTANAFQGSPGVVSFAHRGTGSLVLTPEGRGPSYWYYGQAGADVFEAWADARRHYTLDPANTVIAGSSMGGYGAYKFAALYPDLFTTVLPVVPCPSAGVNYVPPLEPPGGAASALINMTPSLRHVPAMSLQSANDQLCTFAGDAGAQAIYNSLDQQGYRYEARTFYGAEHLLVGNLLLYSAEPLIDFVGSRRAVTNPAHITYVVNDEMSQPEVGLNADHAYWVSGLTVRDTSGTVPIGTVDVRSFGLGLKDAPTPPIDYNQGLYPGTVLPFTGQFRTTGPEAADSTSDRVDVTVRNVSKVVIDPGRAGLTCNAAVNVDSDGPVDVILAGCPQATPPAATDSVPTQLIAKLHTEGLGRLPTQSEWQAGVDHFTATGCTSAAIEQFGTGVLTSTEYAALGYDNAARVLTLFRTVLNRDPAPGGFDQFHAQLQAGTPWNDVVAQVHDLPEFADVSAMACGPDPDYDFGWQEAIAVPTSGTGFAGGTGEELQALLDATPPGGTVWLAQKAVVRVRLPLTIPDGVTLATTGIPTPNAYALQGRLVRSAYFPTAMVTIRPGAKVQSVWVDGQRGVAASETLADNDLGQGGYTLTARNTIGVTASVNVSILGGTLVDSMLSNTSGWATVVLGTADGTVCEAHVAGNLVTAYTSDHATVFSDGISNYCDHAVIEHNEVVDATDVGIVSFWTSSEQRQRSEVRFNTVLSAGNNAYGGLVADGTLSNKSRPPDFTGFVAHDNLMWTSDRTHFDVAISVGTRAWFGQNSATGTGASFLDNTTGMLSARVGTGIGVSGMTEATVLGNTLLTAFAPEASPCPRVEIGVSETAGYGSGQIQQPYTDVLIEQCIQTGR